MVIPSPRILSDELNADLELGGIETGEPFIEQQQLRSGRQSARQLDPLLIDVGQLRAGKIALAGQADTFEQSIGLPRGDRGSLWMAAEHPSDHDVFAGGHSLQDSDQLKRARDPRATDFERPPAEEIASVEQHGTAVG